MTAPAAQDPANSDVVVKWLVPERVIFMWARGNVSTSVRQWMNNQAIYMYHSCSTPKIHVLGDYREVTARTGNTKTENTAATHPRRGWMVITGGVPNPLMRALVNFIARITRANFLVTTSVEQGLQHLQTMDPTLPDLQPYWDAMAIHKEGLRS